MILIAIIKEFHDTLGGLGTLHWSFDSWEVFSKYLRVHLARQIQYQKDKSIKISIRVPDCFKKNHHVQQQIDRLDSTEEGGFIDLLQKGKENFEMLKEVLNRMIEEIGELEEYTFNMIEKTNRIDISNTKQARKKVKRICNQMAGRIESLNKMIEFEMPSLQMHFSTTIYSYGKLAVLLADFDTDIEQDVSDTMEIFNEIKKFASDTREEVGSFRQSMVSGFYEENRFDQAKRKSIEVLDNLDQELKSGITLIDEVENLMRNLLE